MFRPSVYGTESREDSARRNIEKILKDRGIAYSSRSLADRNGGFGSSLFVDFPAHSSDLNKVVVAVPYFFPLSGDDGRLPLGVRAAIELAEVLKKKRPEIAIRIAFLADEKSALPADLRRETHLGLRDAVAELEVPERTAFLYLDVEKDMAPLELRHGSKHRIAPLHLISAVENSCAQEGQEIPVFLPFNELYRLGAVAGDEELNILQGEGIQAVLIAEASGRRGEMRKPGPSAEELGAILQRVVIDVGNGKQTPDERYTLIALGTTLIPISEKTAVMLFLAVAALALGSFLVFTLTHRHLLFARGRLFLIRFWAVLLFLLILFLSIRAAGFVLDFAMKAYGAAGSASANGAAAVKILLAFSLYYAAALFLEGRIVPRRAHFYSAAATTLLAASTLFAAVIDFTFVPVFLWAFVLAFVSAALKNQTLAAFPALLAPLQIVLATFAVVGSGDQSASRVFIRGDPWMELYLAFSVLPYLFLFRRASIIARVHGNRRRKPRTEGKTRPIAHHFWTRPLFVLGASATVFAFAANEAKAEMAAVKAERETVSGTEKDIAVNAAVSSFLDRRSVAVSIRPSGTPDRLDVSFSGGAAVQVYDANYPFAYSPDGSSVDFRLGESPPTPMEIVMTLPKEAQGTLRVSGVYADKEKRKAGLDSVRTVIVERSIGGPR